MDLAFQPQSIICRDVNMNKALIVIILLSTLLINFKLQAETNSQGKANTFRWASFEEYKIKRVIEDNIVANAKFPSELDSDEIKQRRKINELESSKQELAKLAEDECDRKLLPSKIKKPKYKDPIGIRSDGSIVRSKEWGQYLNITSSEKYLACIDSERRKPDFINISTMLENEEDLRQKRAEYINKLKQDSDRILRQYAADYAKETRLDLIVTRQSDSIIYNKNEGVLDITESLETYIKNKLAHTK